MDVQDIHDSPYTGGAVWNVFSSDSDWDTPSPESSPSPLTSAESITDSEPESPSSPYSDIDRVVDDGSTVLVGASSGDDIRATSASPAPVLWQFTPMSDYVPQEDNVIIGAKPAEGDTSVSFLQIPGQCYEDTMLRFWGGGGDPLRLFFMDVVTKQHPNQNIGIPRAWKFSSVTFPSRGHLPIVDDTYWVQEGITVRLDYPENPPFYFQVPSRESAFEEAKPARVLHVRPGFRYPIGDSVWDAIRVDG